jgi:hypothetical protein
MQTFGLAKALSAQFIIETANRILPEQFRAKTFKNNCLTVAVSSSAEAYFFKQECETHLERINAALEKPVVERIRIQVNHG